MTTPERRASEEISLYFDRLYSRDVIAVTGPLEPVPRHNDEEAP